MSLFRVIVEGRVLEGFDSVDVKANLARLVRRDESVAARLLEGRASSVKAGIDEASGARYIAALRAIGVACHLDLDGEALVFDTSVVPGDAVLSFDAHIVPGCVGGSTDTVARADGATLTRVGKAASHSQLSAPGLPRRAFSARKLALAGALACCAVAAAVVYSSYRSPSRSQIALATPVPSAALQPRGDSSAPGAPPTPMSAGATMQEPSTSTWSITAQSAPSRAKPTELADLLKRFMPVTDSGQLEMSAGHEADSPIEWMRPVGSTQRGNVVVTFGGEASTGPHGQPLRWTVTKTLGEDGRIQRVELSGLTVNVDVPDAVRAGGIALDPFKCQDVPQTASDSTYVYQLHLAQRRPFWMVETRSCGSAGCGEALTLLYSRAEAAQADCEAFVDPDSGLEPNAEPARR